MKLWKKMSTPFGPEAGSKELADLITRSGGNVAFAVLERDGSEPRLHVDEKDLIRYR